ncbi:MAG: D-alanine--D-alanine ligase [Spirochaetaceae bacterium]|nr:MAG: D-alanine--D-alanine ligase [Spirochaetaceae bacterium]
MTVALLYGGRSGEHEVSLQSVRSIIRNLDRGRFRPLLIGIDKSGRWYLQPGTLIDEVRDGDAALSVISDQTKLIAIHPAAGFSVNGAYLPVDLVFPVLHGTFGEDGTVQGLLEMANLPYVGAGVLGSAVGMDKEISKRIWQAAGLPVTPSITVRRSQLATVSGKDIAGLSKRAQELFGYPLFVKPARAGSSVGVSCVDDRRQFIGAVQAALRFDTKLLIEPAISGQEIECSVIGNASVTAYAPGEIIPSHRFYDYDAKYRDPDGALLQIPARLTETEANEIRRIAAAAHQAIGVEGMSRVDFLVSQPERTIYINEINTIPGFTRISMFPRMCEAAGVPYAELLTTLIELGEQRYREEQSLTFDYSDSS